MKGPTPMTHFFKYSWSLCLALSLGACSNIERSRDLSNPRVAGATLAQQVCSTCHGATGNSISPQFPNLAGQQEAYLVNQLQNFKGHQRMDPPGPEYMWGLSRRLTNAQIEDIAHYFANQVHVARTDQTPMSKTEQEYQIGLNIYTQGIPEKSIPACQLCHGPHAKGLATFPRLAGQHKDYLVRQLHVFQETEFRPNTPMTQITHQLDAQQMSDIAIYLSRMP